MRNQKISILKFIDHWVGGPICIFLALIFRITHPFYKTVLSIPVSGIPPKKILIIKFFGLGSITLASSIISSIRNNYKDTKIYFLTFKDNKQIHDLLSFSDHIVIIDTKNPFVLLKTIVQSIFYLQKERIDIVLDIEFYSKFTTIMSFLSGARWRMGFYLAKFWRNSLVNVPIYFNYSRHILEIYAMFSKALLIENPNLEPSEIVVSAEDKRELMKILETQGINNLEHMIGINIHASDLAFGRRWPQSKFVELIEVFLVKYPHMKVVLTGVKGEMEYSRAFIELLPEQSRRRTVDLTGKISLKLFLALLSELPLFVTNDTGPFHLAKAVRARTISLWGPGSVDLYGPFQKEKERHDVVYKRYPCSPCLYIYRTDAGFFCNGKAPCMEAIEPSEVITLIDRRLKS